MNVPQLRFKGFNDEWQSKKLKDIAEINTGKSKFTNDSKGQFPILGSTGIIGYSNDFDYEGNFILTARVGANAGTIYRFNGKVKISDNTIFIKSTNIVFLNYYLNHFNLKRLSFGTGQPLIKSSELKKLKLLTPKYDEQQKIGTFFSKLDDLITTQTNKVELLKQLKHGYLQKLFPQAGQTTPQLRFKGFYDEWHEKYLKDVVQYENGKGHEQNISQNGDYIVVNSKYISSNGKIKKFTSMPLEILNKNMIVFVLSDVPNGKALAKALIIDKDNKYTLNQRIAGLTVDKNYNVLFIYYLINRNSYFLRFNDGVSQTNMSKSDVLSFKFLIPDLSEQQKICALFAKLDHLIDLQNHKLALLEELKKGYLQKMFI